MGILTDKSGGIYFATAKGVRIVLKVKGDVVPG